MTMYFVSIGPMNSTAIMRTVCIAITKETSTLLEAAMIATEVRAARAGREIGGQRIDADRQTISHGHAAAQSRSW